jgi:glycosyltransferase involved in cell wall biosynthesis
VRWRPWRAAATPLVSVVIPTYNRPRELRLCLDGFAAQTAAPELFEIIVVDDGSTEDCSAAVAAHQASLDVRFHRAPHGGPSAARNAGIRMARAPWLVLYDDDLRPRPELIDRCVAFHRDHPADGDTCLLSFRPDPAMLADPVVRWSFPRLYAFPAAGVHGWSYFWSGSTTCKKNLFRHGEYDLRYRALEDAELALRLAHRVDLRSHYDPEPLGFFTRRLTFAQICRRQYTAGYFSYVLARAYAGAVSFDIAPYNDPERYRMADPQQLRVLLASARSLESGGASSLAVRYKMLCSLWLRAETHARAEGWMAARDGGSADGAGTIEEFLEA